MLVLSIITITTVLLLLLLNTPTTLHWSGATILTSKVSSWVLSLRLVVSTRQTGRHRQSGGCSSAERLGFLFLFSFFFAPEVLNGFKSGHTEVWFLLYEIVVSLLCLPFARPFLTFTRLVFLFVFYENFDYDGSLRY